MRAQFLTPARLTQLADRFWSKVNRRGPDDCWEWQGTKLNRYGQLKVEGRGVRAHRISWAIENGPIPDGYSVLHRCDNPACVNPAHLFLGTQRDNMKDMARKGRAAAGDRHAFQLHPELLPRGERHWNAKVPDCIVRDVVRRYKAGGVSYKDLANELNEIGIQATKSTLRRWVIGLGRSTALGLLLALVLIGCPGPLPIETLPLPALPVDERPAPVPHPGEPPGHAEAPSRWTPWPEPDVSHLIRMPEPPPEEPEPEPEPPAPEPEPEPPAPEPEPEPPAPVDHPGEPFDEIPAVGGRWTPYPEPVIDWGQFLLPPTKPHEPEEPEEPEDPEPEPDPETPGLPPEHIEETCTFEHVTRWNDVLQRVVIVSTRLRGPNEKACCIAMHAAQTQPRAEGKMCGCSCDKETDTCEQMKLQPPHHSNKDRDRLVCSLAGPFVASQVDAIFE